MKGLVLIVGDLNAWTEDQGGDVWVEVKEVFIRSSKHRKTDQEGRILLNLIGEAEWFICDGNTKGDEDVWNGSG